MKLPKASGDEMSEYCPKCGSGLIEHTMSGVQLFDEHGWYNSAAFKCAECKHEWSGRLMLTNRLPG
jgi:hypothetical protein